MIAVIPILVLMSWAFHARFPFLWACVWGSIAQVLFMYFVFSTHFGWADATFLRSVAVATGIAIIVSIATGLARRSWRESRNETPHDT